MEINSSSANLFYQTTNTNNKNSTNQENLQFTTLLSSNQESLKSSSSVKDAVYFEQSEFESFPYYPNDLDMKIQSFRQHKFFEAQAQLPWEEQFVYTSLQFENYTPEDYKNDEYIKNEDPLAYDWIIAMRSATNGNKYDNAPEFEAFVNKWMDKGLSEEEALQRAGSYAAAGLLDYGSQKAIPFSNLPLTDTKQHGLWLIDNPPLKQAILEVFDSLSTSDVIELQYTIFHGTPEEQNGVSLDFEKLLQQYGVKLEDLKQKDPQFAQDNPEVFTGDINLQNDNSVESQAYNNFIFKTLIGFFKDRIESLDRWAPQDPNVDFTSTKDSINLLIDTFQEKVNTYNENIKSGSSMMTKK